jgi:hypothetical protein
MKVNKELQKQMQASKSNDLVQMLRLQLEMQKNQNDQDGRRIKAQHRKIKKSNLTLSKEKDELNDKLNVATTETEKLKNTCNELKAQQQETMNVLKNREKTLQKHARALGELMNMVNRSGSNIQLQPIMKILLEESDDSEEDTDDENMYDYEEDNLESENDSDSK